MKRFQNRDQERSMLSELIHTTLVAGSLGLASIVCWNILSYISADYYLKENKQVSQEVVQKELSEFDQMKIYERIFYLGSEKAFVDYLREKGNK